MENIVVKTNFGDVRGTEIDGVYVWKGIPYAKALTGSLRWQGPAAAEPWEGIKDCSEFGPHAVQLQDFEAAFTGARHDLISEDCLSLNIWAEPDGQKGKPVVVWIHGGALCCGDGYGGGMYDGTSFAKDGIVYVSINYRLGVLGFLYLGDIAGEEYAAGNYGIRDQIAALQWIRENIAAFGGDPDNVTVMGQSAGACSISYLTAMPEAEGLYHKLIAETMAQRPWTRAEATGFARKLLDAFGLKPEEYRKLFDIPAMELYQTAMNPELFPTMAFGAVVDGVSMPESPYDMLKTKKPGVPLLCGANKNEYVLYNSMSPMWGGEWDRSFMKQTLQAVLGDKWAAFEKTFPGDIEYQLFEDALSCREFIYPTMEYAERAAGLGNPVYVFQFAAGLPIYDNKSGHGCEMPYVFDNHNNYIHYFIPEEHKHLAKVVHRLWVSFIKTGVPSDTWKPYNTETRPVLVISDKGLHMEEDAFGVMGPLYRIFAE